MVHSLKLVPLYIDRTIKPDMTNIKAESNWNVNFIGQKVQSMERHPLKTRAHAKEKPIEKLYFRLYASAFKKYNVITICSLKMWYRHIALDLPRFMSATCIYLKF